MIALPAETVGWCAMRAVCEAVHRQRMAAERLLSRRLKVPAYCRGPVDREHALYRALVTDENLLHRGAWLAGEAEG